MNIDIDFFILLMVECNICYEDITSKEMILQCKHTFHKHCIKKWFKKNNYKLCKKCKCTERYSSCPMCRCNINLFSIKPKYVQFYESYILNKTRKCIT